MYTFGVGSSPSVDLPNGEARVGHCLVNLGQGRFFLGGGWTEGVDYTSAYIYDMNTDVWNQIPDLSLGRSFAYCGYAMKSDGTEVM